MKGRFLMRLGGRGEAGFTLVETLVALVVATVVFTSLAYVAMGALRASLLSRTNQQAIDFGDQRLEQVRDLPFSSVAMDSADLSGDSNILSCSGKPCVTLGDGTTEPLYVAVGGIAPHVVVNQSTETSNIAFTTRTYITTPTDAFGATYRRVSVEVTWSNGPSQLTRWVSSVVSYTQRGLPLPVFKLTPVGSTSATVTANDSYAAYGFDLNNQGAGDHWNLAMSGGLTWKFYLDNGNGAFDPTVDPLLTDTTSDGIVDTGYLAPTQSVRFWVATFVPTGTPATASPLTQSLTATSVAQPTAASGTSSATTTLTILAPGATAPPSGSPPPSTPPATAPPSNPTTCPAGAPAGAVANNSYTLQYYTLHNRSALNSSWPPSPYPATDPIASTSTTGQGIPLVMATDQNTVPIGRALPVYSSNLSPTVPGRILNTYTAGTVDATGLATSSDTTQVVDWRGTTQSKWYAGTAGLSLWVGAVPGDSVTSISLKAQLYKWAKNSSTGVYGMVGLGSPVTLLANPFTCAGVQQFTATLPVSSVKLGASEFIGVRVWDTGATRVRLAYDEDTTYPATLVLPEK